MATGTCPWCGRKVDKVIMFRGDIVGCRYCGIHTKQTNADRIRAMTDEELSRFLWKCGQHCCPPINCAFKKCDAEKCWLDWLRKEAT